MKTLTMHSVVAVAALAVAAVSASAQTYKAEIPMAFHAGAKALPAGTYKLSVVQSNNGVPIFTINSAATGRGVYLLTSAGPDASAAWRKAGRPVLSFDCLGESCTLRQLWNGRDSATYKFPSRKAPAADKERMASITIALTKGD
jgi:hypothetical protein